MFVANSTTSIKAPMALAEGSTIPAFTSVDDAGQTVTASTLKGTWTVLYFYPKDDTSGCTAEACDFRDNMARITRTGATVVGVSPDNIKSHVKFKDKHTLPFPLLSDEDHSMCEAFDVWKQKSMYGRTYMGVERTTYIIDPTGVIRRTFAKVSVKGHVDAVLASLTELGATA
jgi:peroxiredoxin Q/BCP